jgi:sec-independent protein translocase protein TatC
MPLTEHLRELRSRLVKASLGLIVGLVVGFILFEPIWRFLQRPFCQIKASHSLDDTCNLVYRSVFDPIMVQFKVAMIFALVATSPWWLYQLWAFVTPGLLRRERRWAVVFVSAAAPLFIGGATLAYFVMNKGLSILLSFAPDHTLALIDVNHYLKYFSAMLLIFGASFEVPLLIVVLNLAGVLTYDRLRRSRRWTIMLVFVFSALVTPSGDPFTMVALAVPMNILFELATQVARLHDRRAAKRAAADPLADIGDDETSPLDLTLSDTNAP